MHSIRRLLAAVAAVAAVIVAGSALAGPLTPPSGPVGSSMKTLDQVEPRRPIRAADIPLVITQPGSYYLVENITMPSANTAIRISASDVTIDLNGFTLRGPGGTPTPLLDGIRMESVQSGVWIRNGMIAGFQGDGINLSVASANVRISDVCVTGCGWYGVRVGGIAAVVERCTASLNGKSGFSRRRPRGHVHRLRGDVQRRRRVPPGRHGVQGEGCSAAQNSTDGFRAQTGMTDVSECKAYSNGGDGFVFTNLGTTIRDCVAAEQRRGRDRGVVALARDREPQPCQRHQRDRWRGHPPDGYAVARGREHAERQRRGDSRGIGREHDHAQRAKHARGRAHRRVGGEQRGATAFVAGREFRGDEPVGEPRALMRSVGTRGSPRFGSAG